MRSNQFIIYKWEVELKIERCPFARLATNLLTFWLVTKLTKLGEISTTNVG